MLLSLDHCFHICKMVIIISIHMVDFKINLIYIYTYIYTHIYIHTHIYIYTICKSGWHEIVFALGITCYYILGLEFFLAFLLKKNTIYLNEVSRKRCGICRHGFFFQRGGNFRKTADKRVIHISEQ